MNEYIYFGAKGIRGRVLDQRLKKTPVALRPDHRLPISKPFFDYQSNKTKMSCILIYERDLQDQDGNLHLLLKKNPFLLEPQSCFGS